MKVVVIWFRTIRRNVWSVSSIVSSENVFEHPPLYFRTSLKIIRCFSHGDNQMKTMNNGTIVRRWWSAVRLDSNINSISKSRKKEKLELQTRLPNESFELSLSFGMHRGEISAHVSYETCCCSSGWRCDGMWWKTVELCSVMLLKLMIPGYGRLNSSTRSSPLANGDGRLGQR